MRLIALSAVFSLTAMTICAAEDPAVAAFTKNVNDYVKIRDAAKQKASNLPKNATPEQIQRAEQGMQAEIRTARANAKPGDIFTPDIQPLFRKILKDNFAGPENKGARDTARQGNPKNELDKGEAPPAIQVNAVYPKSSPTSSVPALLLLQLPKLPKDIEYRFNGQTLILLDSLSNIVIDYMKGAAPEL
jgi:hypothetical protein